MVGAVLAYANAMVVDRGVFGVGRAPGRLELEGAVNALLSFGDGVGAGMWVDLGVGGVSTS